MSPIFGRKFPIFALSIAITVVSLVRAFYGKKEQLSACSSGTSNTHMEPTGRLTL